jgi:hypothetical protein
MNQDQAVTSFVRDNLHLLLAKDLKRKSYNSLHTAFFYEKHKNKFGKPLPKDVLKKLLIISKPELGELSLDKLRDTYPVFKLTGERNLEKILEALEEDTAPLLDNDKISRIRARGSYIVHKEDAQKRFELEKFEMSKELSSKLEKQEAKLEEKKLEYNDLPSVLDAVDDVSELFEAAEDVIPKKKKWWQNFYLRDDPFPNFEGFLKIDESLHESIISKTDILQEIESELTNDPDCLMNKASLLSGDFGFGKTTLIEYVALLLTKHKHTLVRITPRDSGGADPSAWLNKFYQTAVLELKDKIQKTPGANEPSRLAELPESEQLRECIEALLKRFDGIVVVLDDYHKWRSDYKHIFEFLGYLQTFKDKLLRRDLKVGFIVSGIPQWEEELEVDQHLRGFLDGDTIQISSEINLNHICEVFNKRIKAFSYDCTGRVIRSEFVKLIMDDLRVGLGVRGCLKAIIKHLNTDPSAVFDTKIDIPEEDFEVINDFIEEEEYVHSRMIEFKNPITSVKGVRPKDKIAALETFVQIYIQGGITEEKILFKENLNHFYLLKEFGLIQKRKVRSAKGAQKKQFQWVLQQNFSDVVERIKDRQGYDLPDYFLKIYTSRESENVSLKSEVDLSKFSVIKNYLNNNTEAKPFNDLLQDSISKYQSIYDKNLKQYKERDCKDIETSFISVSQAYFLLDGTTQKLFLNDGSSHLSHWYNHPRSNELILHGVQRSLMKLPPTVSEKVEYFRDLSSAVEEVYELIGTHSMKVNQAEPLYTAIPDFSEDQLYLFDEFENSFLKSDSDGLGSTFFRIVDNLEKLLREYYYLGGCLLYDNDYAKNLTDKGLRKTQAFNKFRNPVGQEGTLFQEFTRSQYPVLFNNKTNTYFLDFIKHLEPWSEGYTEDFIWQSFKDGGIDSSHQKSHKYHASDKADYRKQIRAFAFLIKALNKQVREIPFKSVYLICSGQSNAPDEYLYKAMFKLPGENFSNVRDDFGEIKIKTGVHHHEHALNDAQCDLLEEKLKSRIDGSQFSHCVINLLDGPEIRNYYGLQPHLLCCYLAYLHHVSDEFEVKRWYGSSVAVTRN